MSAYDAEDLYDEDLINEIENQKHATASINAPGDEDIPDDILQEQQTTFTKKRLSEDGGAYGSSSSGEKKTRIEDPPTAQKKGCLADYFKKDDPPAPVPSPSIPMSLPNGYGNASYGSSIIPEVTESPRVCACGAECFKKTVMKEGPNKGRGFWTCPNGGPGAQGHLFEWCEEGSKSIPAISSSQNNDGAGMVPPAVASTSTGTGPPCKCGQVSVQRTVQKEGPNKGRLFHTCPLPQGSQCGFFEWIVNDPSPTNGPTKNTSNYGAAGGGGGGGGGYGNGAGQYSQGGGSGANQGGGGAKSGTCYKCGKEGHWSNNCPEASSGGGGSSGYQKSGGGGGGGSGGGGCFKCGQEGHWSSNCPNSNGGGKGGGSYGGGGGYSGGGGGYGKGGYGNYRR